MPHTMPITSMLLQPDLTSAYVSFTGVDVSVAQLHASHTVAFNVSGCETAPKQRE